ncbi:MAG: hypothetical protein PVG39_07850, partial [Desulfobacteraceae bacterium]
TGPSYEINVEDRKIIKTLKTKGKTPETISPLEPDMPMLDLSVFHTIDYWIRMYDDKKGGKQVYKTYILPSATIRQISIIPGNDIIPEPESRKMALKNYEIKVRERLIIFLWVDTNNRLYRMFVKGPDIDIIRADLFDRINRN